MNLNSIKRGFTRTNPEKGLGNLPGAQKSEHRRNTQPTVRVSGQYISSSDHPVGKLLGGLGYLLSWISIAVMFYFVLHAHEVEKPTLNVVLPSFFLGVLLVHGCAIMAEGFRGQEAPRARKGIIIFWCGTLVIIALSWLL
ncbi:MAG: hypothetical protein ACPGUY_08665 [Akkermansiaceae bacterium]